LRDTELGRVYGEWKEKELRFFSRLARSLPNRLGGRGTHRRRDEEVGREKEIRPGEGGA